MDINLLMIVLQSAVLIFQTYLTISLFNIEKKSKSTYECDSLFMQLEKTLLENPKLYTFYSLGEKKEKKEWDSMSEDQKRMYIFHEMNYFLFAFVYRELKKKRISPEYWTIYENWLRKLLKYSPDFLKVSNYEKDNYEPEFAQKIEEIRRETNQFPE